MFSTQTGSPQLRRWLVGAVILTGFVLGAAGSVALATSFVAASAGPATTSWARNAHGVTYGSGLDAKSPADEPDLIQVEATNGRTGYAYKTDLEGPMPSSPAQAIKQQQSLGAKTVPVYAVDGTTRIGQFVITPSVGSATAPQ